MFKEPIGKLAEVYEFIPKGADHPISTKKLRDLTGLSERSLRDAIRSLVVEYNKPIGSLRKAEKHGYFIVTESDELNVAIQPLQEQVTDMQIRLKVLHTFEQET